MGTDANRLLRLQARLLAVLELHGLEDLGLKLNDMSKKVQWDVMAKEISDDMYASSPTL